MPGAFGESEATCRPLNSVCIQAAIPRYILNLASYLGLVTFTSECVALGLVMDFSIFPPATLKAEANAMEITVDGAVRGLPDNLHRNHCSVYVAR
jgi:hypothetical protein